MNNLVYYQNHFSRKRFGQNFLNDQRVIDSIISSINPKKSQEMVEIGPGLAALTYPISKYLDHLTVIELDRNLVDYLQSFPFSNFKLIVYQQDAMKINFSELSKKIGKPLRVFGNLPYNISTPLMFHLFQYVDSIIDMFFMLQKEIADRLVAKPNSKKYGKLSIMAQYHCDITLVFKVPRNAFLPMPKVDSMLVHLIPHAILPSLVKDLQMLSRITTEAFNQRRKTIRNSLRNLFSTDELISMCINPSIRAENISVSQYCEMANYLNKRIKSK